MTDLLNILSDLSQVLGVPAALCLAWGAFVLRDHGRRISKLEDDSSTDAVEHTRELNAIYDRINAIATDVAYIKGRMEDK